MRTYPNPDSTPVREVVARAYREQPNLRLAITPEENVIGAWSQGCDCFVIVASLAITGEWVSMPYELLINGERPVRNWTEVPRPSAS